MSRSRSWSIRSRAWCWVAIGVLGAATSALSVESQRQPEKLMPVPTHGMHITYRISSQELALPAPYVRKMVETEKGRVDAVQDQRIAYARSRIADGPVKTGVVEYWCSDGNFLYADLVRNSAVAYDGKKAAFGRASDMLEELVSRPNVLGEGRGVIDIFKDADRIDDAVPYLGFYQPGKRIFGAGVVLRSSKILADGEDRVYRDPSFPNSHQAYVLHYDKSRHVTSLTVYGSYDLGAILAQYQFSDFGTVGGFTYPREVVCKRYRWYQQGKKSGNVPDSRAVYRVTDVKAEDVSYSVFTLNSTRLHTQIEDRRYKIPGSRSDELVYHYVTPNLTIDEASRAAYESALGGGRTGQLWVSAIRLACLLLALILCARFVRALIRREVTGSRK